MFSNWFTVGVQCTRYRSVLMCAIGMYSDTIDSWLGTVYPVHVWVDVRYMYIVFISD